METFSRGPSTRAFEVHHVAQLDLRSVVNDVFIVIIVNRPPVLLFGIWGVHRFPRRHQTSVRSRDIFGRIWDLSAHEPNAVAAFGRRLEVRVVCGVVNFAESDLPYTCGHICQHRQNGACTLCSYNECMEKCQITWSGTQGDE